MLPQLTPVRAPWADATRTLWTCHHIRAVSHANGYPYKPKVAIAYFYTAHDNIHHVRVLWSTLPLLLFSDPRMVYPVDVYQFQGQAVHRLNQQHIQLGLRKGMTVLVYYRVQSGAHVNEIFQAVLIAQESVANRGKRTENRLWKRVVPSETEFAWLPPNIAWAFCSDALRRRRECQYFAFNEAHMGLQGRAFQANIFIEDMVFLGDTRSAEELAVFTNMAPEWLCLGCGLRVEENFTPIFPGERGPLFAASVKLLQFALRASSASATDKGLTEDEGALLQAIQPLVTNPDCHFLAVLTALVQSILEGRTDCPISGVFGAGKTRSAAAMIAGLLVMDPSLKVMVVTKENAAAHAFAKHIESLQLPPSLEEKFGRLVVPVKQDWMFHQATAMTFCAVNRWSLVAEVASTRNVRSRTVQLRGGWRRWTWPSMMRASSMGTLMNPRPLHGFPAKGLLFGVETISKRREDCARVRKPGPLDASWCEGPSLWEGTPSSYHQLTQQEQDAQKEEAYARATVVLTRAQQICVIGWLEQQPSWAAWNMGPASVDSMPKTTQFWCSGWKMRICSRQLMILHSCTAYSTPVLGWTECIRHWP